MARKHALRLQAMTADTQRQTSSVKAGGTNIPTKQPVASLGVVVTDGPQLRCADTAVMEALRQLQLVPTALHGELQAEGPSTRHGVAADPGECSSPLSPEAIAKLCGDDEESQDLQLQQQQQVGSPQSVLRLLHASRTSSADGGAGWVGGRRALPASGLGCGIFGASAVWGF